MTSGALSQVLHDAMARHAADGRIALSGPLGETDYATLSRQIDIAAGSAAALDIPHGAPVGLLVPRGAAGIAAFFGLMAAGACPCFIEPKLTEEALLQRMQAVGMQYMVADPAVLPESAVLRAAGIRVLSPEALCQGGACTTKPQPQDRAMMLFTSGSTGQPKGVVLSQANLLSNAEGVIAHTDITPADRLLHVMPLYHTNGINNQLIAPFLAGATVVLIDKFRPDEILDLIRLHKPTYVTGVPTIYARVLPHLSSREGLESLRFLRCGSAPITPELHRQIEEAFGIPLLVSYGLSEATCTSTMNPPHGRRIGSVGTVLRGQDVKLFTPGTQDEVAQGQEGEICIGGPSLMLGYLGAGAEQPIKEGWLRTGDLGMFDPDGYLSITGRIKDVIIRGGENISPQLIETTLSTHPAVHSCCVVGGPHADLGEVPVAFVVLRDAARVEEDHLRAHVLEKLPRIYAPADIRFVESLPENGVGKVDRKQLKQLVF